MCVKLIIFLPANLEAAYFLDHCGRGLSKWDIAVLYVPNLIMNQLIIRVL